MQNITGKSDTGRRSARREALPAVAGAALGVAGVGAALALGDFDSPLRAPFALFFLLAAPACAVAAALRGLDPLGRWVAAAGGAIAIDLLIAQAMLALHLWSVAGGVVAVAAVSLVLCALGTSSPLLAHARRHRDRAARSRTS
ncbi:hypothetical protein [Streptomyces varsoviensis]|uniref:Integral membrane protein n=1 Tax=Streptomyces varsoviensis TaxID=67373 RepID=A0ABR5IWJ8_9ACTN|nr:hypothetical protein [Streptomyces varsoviensis]KOG85521.1 hypothetical protein ADK38_36210 [Streptomyces varsoviensis]